MERGSAVSEIDTLMNNEIEYISDVPVLTRCQIETAAEQILEFYMPDALTSQSPSNIEFLIENAFHLQLEIQTLQPDGAILGETIFKDGYREVYNDDNFNPKFIEVKTGTIILDASMSDMMETRTAFTEAHELGHWLLHKRFYGSTTKRACHSLRYQRMYFPHHQAKTPIEWTEWQANTFAAAILLPRPALRSTLREFLDKNKVSWKRLVDFTEYKNRVKYSELLDGIARTYNVSKETARLRMNKLCDLRFPY